MTRLQLVSLSLNGPAGSYGSLPSSWSNMSALQHLSIRNGAFSGGLPADWASLHSLRELRLHNVSVAPFSALPHTWASNMTSLSTLVLDELSGVTGPLPTSWMLGFNNLTALHLKRMPALNLTANDIASLMQAGSLGGLQDLAVEHCNVSGALPSVAGR